MRDSKWRFQATLEFEYPVPEGSDLDKELARCMQSLQGLSAGVIVANPAALANYSIRQTDGRGVTRASYR